MAQSLTAVGVSDGVLVGVLLERGVALVVAALAILKAGGVYVPLDPAYAAGRLRSSIDDASIPVLLAATASAPALRLECQPVLEEGDLAILTRATTPVVPNAGIVKGTACIMFTSGSQGAPKGVMLGHRAIVNRLTWGARAYPYASDDVLAAKTSIGFVDSLGELFGGLLAGVRTAMLDADVVRDPALLSAACAKHRVTRLTVVPTVLRSLLELDPTHTAALAKHLRIVVSSGEPLSQRTALAWPKAFPATQLVNLYGCTEAAADSTFFDEAPKGRRDVVPIGRPVANTRVYLLDTYSRLCPAGVIGELCIAGHGLASGYLNAPSLTAERFVEDPFYPGEKLYRTGDYGRQTQDGVLLYEGRRDSQIKLRGIRIEPAEIEVALRTAAGVRDGFVLALPTPGGDQQLVAYVQPIDGVDPPSVVESLRQHLLRALPSYMVPTRYAVVHDVPKTTSGKVDRRALARLLTTEPPSEVVAPRDAIEARLVALWQELLHQNEFGVFSDFFALGGHSLLVAKLISRLQSEFDVSLNMHDFFREPTVAGLATLLRAGIARGDIHALMKEIEQMSDDEVDEHLTPV